MKNLSDIISRVKFEIQHAMNRADFEHVEYYLFYKESTAEADGGIISATKAPGAYWFPLSASRIPRNMTAEQYAGQLANTGSLLGRLPVLSIYEIDLIEETEI